MALDSQELSHIAARLGLSTRQAREHLQPWFLPTMMVMLSELLEGCDMVNDDREGMAHRLLSGGTNPTFSPEEPLNAQCST